jgi:hypothetical protein
MNRPVPPLRSSLKMRSSERDICDRIAYDCSGEVEVYLGSSTKKTKKRGDVVIPYFQEFNPSLGRSSERSCILIEAKTCKGNDYASTLSHAFKQLHDYRSDGCDHAYTKHNGVLPISIYCASVNPFTYKSRTERGASQRRHEGIVILAGRFNLGWVSFDRGWGNDHYQFWKGDNARLMEVWP